MAGTIQRVASEATLTPEHLWLLACSAIIASIGLDVSSAAVIIGAMLISPLMGPILGVGLGLGVTDRDLLQRSLRELGFATVFTVAVSAGYFLFSPLATPTAELAARTHPTLLDVGVAFFGGVAGIVAGSRRIQSLALPGVAIATALMPPLCTAGFGLATGHWSFFFGAFYLYSLNAVFIAVSTLAVVRFLRFPHHAELTLQARRREQRLVATVALVATLPSVYFLVDAVRSVRADRRIAEFVHHEVEGPGRAAPQWDHHRDKNGDVLVVYVAGQPVEGSRVDSLQAALGKYGLPGVRLELVQSDISARDLQRFQGDVQREILRATVAAVSSRDSTAALRARSDSTRLSTAARAVAAAFPEIATLTYAPRLDLLAHDSISPPVVFLSFSSRVRAATRREVLARAQAMLRASLGSAALVVRQQP